MTLMLAAVADPSEAQIALGAGADIIDLGDFRAAIPGAVLAPDAMRAIADAVGGRRPIVAALGDLGLADDIERRARGFLAMGVDEARLVVDAGSLDRHEAWLARLARRLSLIGVLFADREADFSLVARLAALGFKGVMLDLADKANGRLTSHLDAPKLAAFCQACRMDGLASWLAGSLEAPDIPRLLLVKPDVLAFRGALCAASERHGPLDPKATALVRDLIPREHPHEPASANVDWRLLDRGQANDSLHESEVDCVFVRDFVAQAQIGAYDFERDATQRVRFNVDAKVRRVQKHIDDMRAIFSYDMILDAIRLSVGAGHVDFVETLAENVARLTLEHPRVVDVRVRVEKLDVIEGAVGVEIARGRKAAVGASLELFGKPPTR